MFSRITTNRLHYLAKQFPAVLILGARQVGKTTLARAAFPDLRYLDLEDPATQLLFAEGARFQLDVREGKAAKGLILDEAQRVPEVFAALRGVIDADRTRMGRFIILGSAQPTLVKQVSESLAGRIGILELSPLTVTETAQDAPSTDYRRLWLSGGFPDAFTANQRGGNFRDWWEAYLRTYVERDLPALGISADPLVMRRLMNMLAHGQGGLTNLNQLAGALGVSQPTVTRYVDILEQSFLLRRLPPYFRNIGKRLTKSPKLYLRDTGLLHHLLNINTQDDLDGHPIRGASWETFVLEDLLRREAIKNPYAKAYFWRTAGGAEVDLLLERGSDLHAIEIKTARAVSPYLARGLRAILDDTGAVSATIIDQGEQAEPLAEGVTRRGFADAVDWLP